MRWRAKGRFAASRPLSPCHQFFSFLIARKSAIRIRALRSSDVRQELDRFKMCLPKIWIAPLAVSRPPRMISPHLASSPLRCEQDFLREERSWRVFLCAERVRAPCAGTKVEILHILRRDRPWIQWSRSEATASISKEFSRIGALPEQAWATGLTFFNSSGKVSRN